ncbi:hypothetical protein SUGI_0727840 [Cryptomeria japonica]|nr:hypothetical protein SUGI_0727840 [Cryptomeria japonica]
MASKRVSLVSMLAVLLLLSIMTASTAMPLTDDLSSAGITAANHCDSNPVKTCGECSTKIRGHYKCVPAAKGGFTCCECTEC